MRATVIEEDPIAITSDDGEKFTIRVFSFTLNAVTVQVSSYGASILRILIPSRRGDTDDVVLGFKSPERMYEVKNPPYFNCVVGRVANRIKGGILQLKEGGEIFQLDCNNGSNHLHGGFVGFDKRNWEASIVSEGHHPCVVFSLLSLDGDQHYPGSVEVKVTYSLQPSSHWFSVRLCLRTDARLVGERPTPFNLAQHSYFNLHRHDSPAGCLDHLLTLYADAYNPVDETSIPRREVLSLSKDAVMDWRQPRLIKQALVDYAVAKAGRSEEDAKRIVESSRVAPNIGTCGTDSSTPGQPYGFDHNYVIMRSTADDNGLYLVACLAHMESGRRLLVRSDAPGVQLYTANFLDGVSLNQDDCKDSAVYGQWQGVCFETQFYPDSVSVDETLHPEFAKGRCPVLNAQHPSFASNTEYEFEYDAVPTNLPLDPCGISSEGEWFASIDDMWEAQGVLKHRQGSSSWYHRAAEYYEENCESALDGVLGGFASLSELDLKGSRDFVAAIEHLRNSSFRWSIGAACECGAGIGRVTKGLLLPLGVPRCDLVEASSRLISAAPDYIGDGSSSCRFYCSSLQDWEPQPNTYSIIWIQWVLCYLIDDDAVAFLQRCSASLVSGGYIVLKENTCLNEGFVLDEQDASVTRSVPHLRRLAQRAGLQVVYQKWEQNFPTDIFPVPMLALQQ